MNEISIKILKGEFGYNREEAVNILTNLNPDGSKFEQLPF